MNWKKEWKTLLLIIGIFLIIYFLPVGKERFNNAVLESFHLAKDYAREHVLLCLIPAFFIAGAVGVFLSRNAVMKYLGPKAKKITAYGAASVSGSILAVCSCTILPLFAGIYKMGAGLGPASAFLYSGPAINILAIILTAKVLGPEIGIARALGAVLFSIVIGVLMALIFHKEEKEKNKNMILPDDETGKPLFQNILYFGSMIGILVFANWGKPQPESGQIWNLIYNHKWIITAVFSTGLGIILTSWFKFKWWKFAFTALITGTAAFLFPDKPFISFTAGMLLFSYFISTSDNETSEWFSSSWGFAKQILPLLFLGVIFAGLLLGRPGNEGLIPSQWVSKAVGGNSLRANFFASIAGAFMYFATLTEIPILQGLIDSGMGKGPALALLLAGPALSLPNMLVIRSVLGTKKTMVFVLLVIVTAAFSGILFGTFF